MFNQIANYQDDMHLFIIASLKKVSYLAKAHPVTLQLIAFSMKQDIIEKDRLLFRPGDMSMCMFLIFAGNVAINTKLDNGYEFAIERCVRGHILNADSFLTEDLLKVSALTQDSVHILTIDKSRFLRIIKRDKPLMKRLEKVLDRQLEAGRTTFIDTTSVREHL
jgi:CRP-like cAMP-binding protein